MRVGFYGRVSTEEQAREGFSIPAQIDRGRHFCAAQDWTIVDFYIDEGVSAKDLDRPELQRLLEDIEAGKIDIVLVFRLDRLTRSVLDLYKLLEYFQLHNVNFRSVSEVYDTTSAIGRLFITLVAALAQWERENLAERVRFGMEQMAKEGKWHGGAAPLGYVVGSHGTFEIEEQQASIVRVIYEKFLNGWGDMKITRWLNIQGVPSPKGGKWHASRVRGILTNPVYIGVLRWNRGTENEFDVEGFCPAIVSKENFERAQEIRRERSTSTHPRAVGEYLFTGILKCARCGRTLSGTSTNPHGKKYKYYTCRNIDSGTCDLPKMQEHLVNDAFWEFISSNKLIDDVVAKEVAASAEIAIATNPYQEECDLLTKELQKIKDRRKKWQYLFANDGISFEDYRDRVSEEETRELEIQKRLDEIAPKTTEVNAAESRSTEELIAFLTNLPIVWREASTDQQRVILQLAFERIMINYDKASKTVRFTEVVYK